MKTFAWKILHGRVKTRPSGLNAPVTVSKIKPQNFEQGSEEEANLTKVFAVSRGLQNHKA